MMTVDVNALKKFADTFGPAVAAIPAVLDAVSRQADMDRAMAQYQRELEAAKADVQKVFDEADSRLKLINEALVEAQAAKQKVVEEINDAKKAATDTAKAAEAKAKARLAVLEDKISAAEQLLAGIEKDHAAKQAAFDQEMAAKRAAVLAECEELEKRKATAEKALEALKAKLG